MLVIKLSKVGKTNKKMFRLIVSEKSRDPYGHVLEILGSYNPYSKELQVKEERVNYWLGKGAQMTATVNNLLVGKKVVAGEKVAASKAKPKSEKRLAQLKAKADKKEATTPEPTPAGEVKPTEEAKPVEEVKSSEPEIKAEETTAPAENNETSAN